jgi:hypothetical protein
LPRVRGTSQPFIAQPTARTTRPVFGKEADMSTPNPARDPDGFFRAEEALRPDAVTVYARSMLGSGLLGSLLDRIDRILEAREERHASTARQPAAGEQMTGERAGSSLAQATWIDSAR